MIKRLLLLSLSILFVLQTTTIALDKDAEEFKATCDQLQLALVFGDMDYINAHLALDSIIQAKIKKFSGLVQKQSGFWKRTAAKIVGAGDSVLAKTVSGIAIKEYNKSPRSMRKQFKKNLSLTSYKVKGDTATASGSFMSSPASLYAIKKNGQWIVVGVESPLVDEEIKKLLKIK